MACKLKLIFVFVIYILNSSFYQNTVAQTVKLPKIPGEILVQLSNNFTPSQIAAEFSAYNLCLKQAIVPSLNIWLFTHQAANQNNLYQAMLRHRGVRQVQYNHLLKSRQTTPNDPNFLYQWQYVNDGNSGGVADADIDADQAWDITTGGFTPLNDEIVVAILDDGVDDTHPDITPNLWVNLNETANNSIDDDGNGYIDDVRGWYNAKNNDQIDGGFFGGSHGTPVCGIVGAKGNNNEGVCGVNWNVKLMVVVMDELTEAEALAGYGYVLANRKLYNETSGKKGAFVVASNASWGIDYGKPADAPLWCTMYDALGEQGVLNVGATANLNINVDVEGDLPTTCPSDYLIAVTNVNNKDIKINAAGYGSTHIDLGAFGEDVYTTADGGKYAPFGGTSGAAPHVTGTIALLYAAACPGFTALAKSKPNEAALAVRTYILQSTDPNTSLTGITATNGRLNTFNALQLTLADPLCNDTICIAPYNLQANDITATQATLNWQLFIAAPTYNLRYKAIETADWQTATTTANSYFISNLLACTTYEFQVQAICEDDIESPYSASGVFTTADCCQAPPALLASQINKTT
ncbi:MAG: S8 family serine peptidase, partial [Sphingobacteriales bacterium]|nr:S8 family serine peptidase [Sphingobacteriales bacterium]